MNHKSIVHVGGCIAANGPSDRVDFCNCYHLRFTICVRFKVYRVIMCRDWVHYMAGSSIESLRYGEHSSVVRNRVKSEIIQHFNLNDIAPWNMPGNRIPRCEKGKRLCEPLGHYPDHFIEVVMSNKYGHIVNCIPCKDVLSQDEVDYKQYEAPDDIDTRQMWMWNKRDRETMSNNRSNYRMFLKVLTQIAFDRTYRWKVDLDTNKEDVALKLLTLKIKDHATDEQQITAPLPV